MLGLIGRCLLRIRAVIWKAIYSSYRDRYDINSEFRFNGAGIQLYGDGRIVLGAHSYIGALSTIQAGSGMEVIIGDHCALSHNVRIYTSSMNANSDLRIERVSSLAGSVTIGAGVWIGANVYIGPGISIGEDSVVGANSVVTHSIPPSEIWGGVPARLIRKKLRSDETREC